MGKVILAHDLVLDVPVAIKLIRPDLAQDARFRKLFHLEVRVSAQFAHPHIVPLHDHGETPDGKPYLGLAYANAGSFANFREDVPEWSELCRLTQQLLDALGHLHAREVLHRDLKPENVLLHRGPDGKQNVWLADLGLAHAASKLVRRRGRMEGTPGFMAPEQKEGRVRELGPWTDLYALGVMLWELTTGDRPFSDEDTAASAPLPPYRPLPQLNVPDGLQTLLKRLLAPDPLERYDLAADLQLELKRVAQGHAPVVPARIAPQDSGIPAYHKPSYAPLPERAPPEVGYGASARASLSLFALRELPLVARDETRQRLWEHARWVAHHRKPRIVFVIGEAGTGKTRLVESVARGLEEGGWSEIVRLRYQHPTGKEDGYIGAARNLLRPWHETRDDMTERVGRRLSRERGLPPDDVHEEAMTLVRWCGLKEDDEPPVPSAVGLREVYRHLDTRMWRGLSCLVLDDAQWSEEDGDGLSMVETLLAADHSDHERALLVLVTLRTEEMATVPGLKERTDDLVEQGAIRLDLERLSRAETKQLLDESLTLAPELAHQVVERCEGNPLFARQLLLEWAERGWLVDQGGLQFELAPNVDASAVLPKDAAALFRERTQGLAEASGNPKRFRNALHLAALAGAVLPRTLLETLMSDLRDFSIGCGLWKSVGDQMRFDSSMLHQAVRSEAELRDDLTTLHRELGRHWQEYSRATGEHAHLQVGRHAALGEDVSLAISHLLPACEHSWHSGRTRDLEEASARVLGVTSQHEPQSRQHAEACLWRARAFDIRGNTKEASRLFSEAKERYVESGDGAGQSSAHAGLASNAMRAGQLEDAEREFNLAIGTARSAGAASEEALAIYEKAWFEQQKRNFDGAGILFQQALHRLEGMGDDRNAGRALLGLAFIARRTGQFAEAIELYDEAAETSREGDDPTGTAMAWIGLAQTHNQLSELDASAQHLRSALQLAEDLGATRLLMTAKLCQADLQRQRGNTEDANALYTAVHAWAKRNRVVETTIQAALRRAFLFLELGDLRAVHSQATEACTWLESVPGHWLWATYRLVVATYVAHGEDEEVLWQWLWQASELGLKDTVDRDNTDGLLRIAERASTMGWSKTLQLTSSLLLPQIKCLQQSEFRERLSGIGLRRSVD